MLRVGTSGWQYRDWRGRLYPRPLATARWLEHYASSFATVEVNNTFYRLPPPTTFANWAARVPNDFTRTAAAAGIDAWRVPTPAEVLLAQAGRSRTTAPGSMSSR